MGEDRPRWRYTGEPRADQLHRTFSPPRDRPTHHSPSHDPLLRAAHSDRNAPCHPRSSPPTHLSGINDLPSLTARPRDRDRDRDRDRLESCDILPDLTDGASQAAYAALGVVVRFAGSLCCVLVDTMCDCPPRSWTTNPAAMIFLAAFTSALSV